MRRVAGDEAGRAIGKPRIANVGRRWHVDQRVIEPAERIVAVRVARVDALNARLRVEPLAQVEPNVRVQVEAIQARDRVHAALAEIRGPEAIIAERADRTGPVARDVDRWRLAVEISARIAEPDFSERVEDDLRDAVAMRSPVVPGIGIGWRAWLAPATLINRPTIAEVPAIAARPI